ncbi:MAG: hypothetical protein JNK61_09175 [Bacteroidia bacterium]|nr:hypothetical protein [Bacteroidia bacterium]
MLVWVNLLLVALQLHPFYMSVTQLQLFANKPMQITCRIFTDDLEAALKESSKTTIDLTKPEQQTWADSSLKKYLAARLHIKADNKVLQLTYLGYEITDEATTIYLEGNTGLHHSILIKNTILIDRLPQQLNIVHVLQNGKTQSNKCNKEKQDVSFNLKN